MATTPDPNRKPVPEPTPDSRPFWEACGRGELVLQYCIACGRYQFYPRAVCAHCHGRQLEWRPVSGRGRVWSYSVVHRPVSPAFAAEVPYVVAIVELAEGPHMMANVVGCPPDAVRVGMEVQVSFQRRVAESGAEVALPVFKPVA